MRRLIINADDFGFTRDVNAGIVHAHNEGVLTSTTLMANGDAFKDAVRLAHEHRSLDVGCHLVLVQGHSLSTGRLLPDKPTQLLIALAKRQIDLETELRAQIRRVIECGLRPTHLDSHKHTHIVPRIFRTVVRLAQEFQIPYVRLPIDATLPYSRQAAQLLRNYYRRFLRHGDVRTTDHFTGFRLTGTLTEATFAPALMALQQGTTEFMCHPGYLGAELRSAATRLKETRLQELEALTSPRIRQLIEEQNIQLTTFAAHPS